MNAELLRELARIARSSELHDLRVGLTPDETDALANMLEREHEEAERLRRILLDFRALAVSMPMTGITSKAAIRWIDDALAARKGVSDE